MTLASAGSFPSLDKKTIHYHRRNVTLPEIRNNRSLGVAQTRIINYKPQFMVRFLTGTKINLPNFIIPLLKSGGLQY